MIHILVVAAYRSVRAGLHALLDDGARLQVVSEASGSEELGRLLPEAKPDVVVVDDSRSDRAAVIEICKRAGIGLVLLTDEPDAPLALIESGLPGWGILLKEAEPDEITAAITSAAAGLIVLDPTLIPALQQPRERGTFYGEPEEGVLTGREREVLQLLAQGLPNKIIATRLTISQHTVKFHVASILGKLNAASRTEAVTQGARKGLVIL